MKMEDIVTIVMSVDILRMISVCRDCCRGRSHHIPATPPTPDPPSPRWSGLSVTPSLCHPPRQPHSGSC